MFKLAPIRGEQGSTPLSVPRLAKTVADGVAKQDANRATVHEALARPEVQGLRVRQFFPFVPFEELSVRR